MKEQLEEESRVHSEVEDKVQEFQRSVAGLQGQLEDSHLNQEKLQH